MGARRNFINGGASLKKTPIRYERSTKRGKKFSHMVKKAPIKKKKIPQMERFVSSVGGGELAPTLATPPPHIHYMQYIILMNNKCVTIMSLFPHRPLVYM